MALKKLFLLKLIIENFSGLLALVKYSNNENKLCDTSKLGKMLK